jgi:hypothetical protein
MEEIRELKPMDRYDETVRQIAAAEVHGETVVVVYRGPLSGLPYYEPMIPMGITETRGAEGHQLLVREPDDAEQQPFTIELDRLVRIEPHS